MSFLQTCCGFYCGMTSLVGIYFFIVLAIMELRGNTFLVQIVQNVEDHATKEHIEIGATGKAVAFFVVAAIEVVFTVACFMCGRNSLKKDQEAMEAEMKK
jgi:ABC-type multidrug transport system permease subunit